MLNARRTFLLTLTLGLSASCAALPTSNRSSDRAQGASTSAVRDSSPPRNGRCESSRTGHPIPVSAGRGDRVALAKVGSRTLAYVANEEDSAVHTVDVDAAKEIAVTPLSGSPSALTLLHDGRLAVALRDRNQVEILEPGLDLTVPLEVRCSNDVASEPVGLATTEKPGEQETLLVTSAYDHTLARFHTADLEELMHVSLARDPRAMAVNGDDVFVTHVSSSTLSVVHLETGMVSRVDVLERQLTKGQSFKKFVRQVSEQVPLNGGQAFGLAMSEQRLYVPMVTVDPGEPKITGAYGSTEIPIKPFVGVVDLTSNRPLHLESASQTFVSHRACMLPRAVAARPNGKLFVACAGIDELEELDGHADNAARAIRRRIHLPAGPIGLALDERSAVVLSDFDHEVTIVPLDNNGPLGRLTLSRPATPRDAAFERGKKVFHDSFDLRISRDGRACASCHPDGRDDGNTWSTPDGPRQTIALAGRVSGTAPYGWFGDHKTLADHLAETMHRLGGVGFTEPGDQSDFAALQTYLAKMPGPSPRKANDARIAEGKALFNDSAQGCAECHALGASDARRHDVGSGNLKELSSKFETPSLAFVSATAPYFHDGRYASLDDILRKGDDHMGHVSQLDAPQRASLVAYMESLSGDVAKGDRDAESFVHGAPPVAIPPDADSLLERASLRENPAPRQYDGVEFDLSTVPIVHLEKPVACDAKSAACDAPVLPSDELVWKNGCAAIPHHRAAFLKLDWRSAGMTSALERCVGHPDPSGLDYWREVSMTSIDPLPDGNLHVIDRQGLIGTVATEVRVLRDIAVDAVPVSGGLFFAYRTQCDACEKGARDVLHLIVASSDEDVFARAELGLEPGQASHAMSVFSWSSISRWNQTTNAHVSSGKATVGDPVEILVRVDASRTDSEREPKVTAGRTLIHTDFTRFE